MPIHNILVICLFIWLIILKKENVPTYTKYEYNNDSDSEIYVDDTHMKFFNSLMFISSIFIFLLNRLQ